MNWWYVLGIVFFPFYACFTVSLCSQEYFEAKLEYQDEFFNKFDPTHDEQENG